MPRSKTPTGYPTVYATLIERVTSTGKEVVHNCGSSKAAQLLRFSFYDFLKACRKSHHAKEQELGELGAGIMFCISGTNLIIRPRDTSEQALSLQDTLASFEQELQAAAGNTNNSDDHLSPGTQPRKELSHEDMIASYVGKNASREEKK